MGLLSGCKMNPSKASKLRKFKTPDIYMGEIDIMRMGTI